MGGQELFHSDRLIIFLLYVLLDKGETALTCGDLGRSVQGKIVKRTGDFSFSKTYVLFCGMLVIFLFGLFFLVAAIAYV